MYLESTNPERPEYKRTWIWAGQQQNWQGVMQTRWLEVLSSDILLEFLPLWVINGWGSAMNWCFCPCRFHSSEFSPGAPPLAASAELTLFINTDWQEEQTFLINHSVGEHSCELRKIGFNALFCLVSPDSQFALSCLVFRVLTVFRFCNALLDMEKKFNCIGKQEWDLQYCN